MQKSDLWLRVERCLKTENIGLLPEPGLVPGEAVTDMGRRSCSFRQPRPDSGHQGCQTAEERAIINDVGRRAYAMQAAVLTQEQGEIVEAAALGAPALPRPECCVFTAAENLCNYMLAIAFRASEIDAATGGARVGRA